MWGADYSNCQNLFDGEYISVNNGNKAENANDFYVSPGERYVALWTTSVPNAMNLYGYNTQGNQVGSWTSEAYAPNGVSSPFSDNYMAWRKGAVFTVPDGVAYLRFNTFGNLSASQQQAWAESFKIYNMDCVDKIKIATTKYNETAFSPLNTALANAISVVDSVVSNTITQAASIATLQAQKQTRPADDPSDANNAENCPAGKKCLLVEDASGVPHWYEIVTGRLPDGYTELEYIESTGTQWIDNIIKPNQKYSFEIKYKHTVSTGYQTLFAVYDGGNGYSYGFMEGSADRGNYAYSGNSNTFTLSYDTSTIYTLYYDGINKKVYRNETEIVDFSDTTGFSGTTGVAPRLFNMINGEHHSNSFNYPFKGYAYGFKVYDDNNNLVRNLIPAKNASGVVGMYDLVRGQFYENAGTGEFIGGQPVFN